MVSLRSSFQDASPHTQHDLLGSTSDLTWPWPEAKFWPDLLRSPGTCFDAAWREENDGAWIRTLAYLVQKLFSFFCQKGYFDVFWPLAAKTLKLAQIWSNFSERTAQMLSNDFSPGLLLRIVSEIQAYFRKIIEYCHNLTFDGLWWPKYWPDLKIIFVNIVELNESFLTLFWILARTHSFGDRKGGGYPPLPVGAKLAQTTIGARVNTNHYKVSAFISHAVRNLIINFYSKLYHC